MTLMRSSRVGRASLPVALEDSVQSVLSGWFQVARYFIGAECVFHNPFRFGSRLLPLSLTFSLFTSFRDKSKGEGIGSAGGASHRHRLWVVS